MKSGIARKLISEIQNEFNQKINNSDTNNIPEHTENILEHILIEKEILNFVDALFYFLEKASQTMTDSSTQRNMRRESDNPNKEENYNKDIELICITDEGKNSSDETRLLSSVLLKIKYFNIIK